MASFMYNAGKKNIFTGAIDLNTDTFKVMLVSSSYTPDRDSHEFRSSVTNEVTGTGYTSGGATLSNVTVTQDNTNDRAVFDADDTTWSNSTISGVRYAIIYKSRGGAASADELVCLIDFATDRASSGGPFTINWNSSGIFAA